MLDQFRQAFEPGLFFFALNIHQLATLRYEGDWASKNLHAPACFLNSLDTGPAAPRFAVHKNKCPNGSPDEPRMLYVPPAASVLDLIALGLVDVDSAPGAARSPWSETDFIACVVNTFANPINPTKTKCFIDRLRPGDAWFTGAFFIKTDPQFLLPGAIRRQPFSKVGLSFEKLGIQEN
jgi:hypothetical protein